MKSAMRVAKTQPVQKSHSSYKKTKNKNIVNPQSAIALRAMRTENRTDKVTRNEVSPSAEAMPLPRCAEGEEPFALVIFLGN